MFLTLFSTPIQAESYLQFGGLQKGFHYKEYSVTGTLIDREDGNIPGISAELARDWGAFSGIFNAGLADGRVTYDGRTQGGIPLITRTKEQILDLSAIISWSSGVQANNNPRLLAGLGHRKWVRDIQATATTDRLYERYQWSYWLVGLNFRTWKNNKWEIGFDGRFLRPIKPSIYVEYPGYDSVTIALGAENSLRVSVPITYQLSAKELILIEGYYQTWNLSRSSSKLLYSGGMPTSGSIAEPDSITEIYGVQLSLRFKY